MNYNENKGGGTAASSSGGGCCSGGAKSNKPKTKAQQIAVKRGTSTGAGLNNVFGGASAA